MNVKNSQTYSRYLCGRKGRTESLEMKICIYNQLTISKDVKSTNGERTLSSVNDAGKTGCPHVEE